MDLEKLFRYPVLYEVLIQLVLLFHFFADYPTKHSFFPYNE